MEALTTQLPAIETQAQPEQAAPGLLARLGGALRTGYEAVLDRVDTLKDQATTLAAIGSVAFVGAQAAELTANAEPVAADGNVSMASTTNSALEQECEQVALAKPTIVKSEVLHTGNFTHIPMQTYYMSTKYDAMPDDCKGLYARGSEAKAQAYHNGHWVNMGYYGYMNGRQDASSGNWQDLGNEKNLHFPVCRARILVKENLSDLSYDSGHIYAPHRVVAKKVYKIPAKILPHKPKGC